MKRILVILVFLFACKAFAKVPLSLNAYTECAYNYTYGHYGEIAALVNTHLASNFILKSGVSLQTSNIYAATVGTQVRFGLPVGNLFIDNEYLYKIFVRNNTQQLCAALSIGYSMDFVKVRIGAFSKLFGAIATKKYHDIAFIVEPFNLLYEIQAFIFRSTHQWNLGLKVSNLDFFRWEHSTEPRVSLLGSCQLVKDLRLTAEVGCSPAGMGNIAINFYNLSCRVGICYSM